MSLSTQPSLLVVERLRKRFGAVQALADAAFTVRPVRCWG